MSDSAITIIAIFLAAILMFVFPLMMMADKTDDITTLSVQTATSDFANDIRTTGVITQQKYDNYILTLASTGNAYNAEITIQKLDENPAKKSNGVTATIGDNVYYNVYTTQLVEELANNGKYLLNEGDIVTVSVKNINTTIAVQLRNFLYKVTGNSANTIAAEATVVVTKSAN